MFFGTNLTWNVNSPVQFTNPPAAQSNNTGDAVSVSAAATDALSGKTISYTATSLPAGASINSSTGAITGTLSDAGFWQTVVTATDNSSPTHYTNTTEIDWTVNGAIAVTDQGDQVNQIGGENKGNAALFAIKGCKKSCVPILFGTIVAAPAFDFRVPIWVFPAIFLIFGMKAAA